MGSGTWPTCSYNDTVSAKRGFSADYIMNFL